MGLGVKLETPGIRMMKSPPKARQEMKMPVLTASAPTAESVIAVLTGGADRPYAYGLSTALIAGAVPIDLIAGDDLDCPEFRNNPSVTFLNLRGSQHPSASLPNKISRVLTYYGRLLRYAATSKAKVFHILWNNKFEFFDRTLLILYYKLLRKKIVLTAHNVNAARRDAKDTYLNRLTLRLQYHWADHIFVHTPKMKEELAEEFRVSPERVTVIPFGINNAVPNTELKPAEARKLLGIPVDKKTILFFGNILPYKGVEYLTAAFQKIAASRDDFYLIIAGRPNNCDAYWNDIYGSLSNDLRCGRALVRPEFINDSETEIYFKAADVVVLPYRHIYQSGVLFLGQSFGLPVLAADVGSLRDDIVPGKTGFVFRPEDSADLAQAIERYFASDLYANLGSSRQAIRATAAARQSWEVVAEITCHVYAKLLCLPPCTNLLKDSL